MGHFLRSSVHGTCLIPTIMQHYPSTSRKSRKAAERAKDKIRKQLTKRKSKVIKKEKDWLDPSFRAFMNMFLDAHHIASAHEMNE